MVQYLDKFMTWCVVKVMPGEEKSQRRAVEQSGNKIKEVLTILSMSIAKQKPCTEPTSISRDTEFKQVLRQRVPSRTMLPKVRAERGTQVVGKSQIELMKVIDTLQRVNLNSVVGNSHRSDRFDSLFQC